MSKQEASVGRTMLKAVGAVFSGIGRLIATVVMVGIITGCIVASVLTVYILNYIGADEEISLEEIELGYTSIIYAYDKEGNAYELQKLYFSDNNRIWVGYNDIADTVKQSVVAIEDKRFWEHDGVDWRRTFGAFANMFIPGASKGGGSTITQQLIKNITQDDDYRVDRKVREIFRALNVSQRYSRDKILETYLNVVSFGAGTNGIESAAQTYFGKSASELDWAEAAAVVGITQYPTAYNPFLYPEANKERQEHVLFELYDQGLITKDEYEAALVEELQFRKTEHENSTEEVQSYFVDHVINQVLADLQEQKKMTPGAAFEQLYKGGYRIYTTVDMEMQEYLEDFYKSSEGFPAVYNKEYPQSCATILDPNGKMLAVVGGIGEKTKNRVFNRATMATRQPGSSLKPLGPYAVAFEYNYVHWSSIYEDSPMTLKEAGKPNRSWPSNYYSGSRGRLTIAQAIQISCNTIPAKLVDKIGTETVFNFLHDRLDMYNLVSSAVINGRTSSDIQLSPMALGALTNGVTPLEMAGGYQIYNNGGYFTSPYCYTEIKDADDHLVLDRPEDNRIRAIDEDTSVVVNKILQTVTTEPGATGRDANLGNMPTAGKTGTSEYDVNQWFIGMTPYYICQVWLGYDREYVINEYGVQEPNSIGYAKYGPPILFKSIMAPLHEGLEYKQFMESDEVVSKAYCRVSGDLATERCGSVGTGWYKKSFLPSNCRGHAGATTDATDPDSSQSGATSDSSSGAGSFEVIPGTTVPSDNPVSDDGGVDIP